MTNKDVKKALECCSNPSINSCKNCSYNNNGEFSCCDGEMYKDALNLITEQEKEIDALKAENEELTKVVSSKVYDLIDNTKEIADAREAWEQQAKIDVLTELKKKTYVNDYCREVVEVEKIDEMIAEVQNAEDKS